MQSSSFPAPALRPVWLQLDCLVRVLRGIVKVFQRRVRAGSVGVEHVVVRLELDCLGELFAGAED